MVSSFLYLFLFHFWINLKSFFGTGLGGQGREARWPSLIKILPGSDSTWEMEKFLIENWNASKAVKLALRNQILKFAQIM